jgi:long-chain acyl-CoA synthetase
MEAGRMREDNLAGMIFKRVQRFETRTCLINKEAGRWREIPWAEVGEETSTFAHGLMALGLRKGDGVSLLSENRKAWLYADFGILAAGGVTVTIYPSLLADEVAYIISNSDSRVAVVSTQEQLDKVLAHQNDLPKLEKIIVFDEYRQKGDPRILSFSMVQEMGRVFRLKNPQELDRRIESIEPEDLSSLVYTSGTTGPPKGAMITHGNILFVVHSLEQVISLNERDRTLSFLPFCHVYERMGGTFTSLSQGVVIALAESFDRLAANMQEMKPTMVLGVPRVYEKVYGAVMKSMEESNPVRRSIFAWAREVGAQASPYRLQDRKMPLPLRWQFALADRLVFEKLRQRFGGRIRFFVTAAAPISKEIIEFFHSLGILILEGYGLTETSAPTNVNRPDWAKFGTVGPPLPGVQIKLAPDGEILVKGGNVFKGYYRDPELTRQVFTADGWFRTGDVGEIDSDGFLRITDRKKDILITAGGKNIAPQNIENMLKVSKWISEAMVFGDRRKYLVALLTLNEAEIKTFARAESLKSESLGELVNEPKIQELIQKEIDGKNKELPSFSTIKKFKVLPRQFTLEDGEVTPTLKLKRRVIAQKFKDMIDAMYEEAFD